MLVSTRRDQSAKLSMVYSWVFSCNYQDSFSLILHLLLCGLLRGVYIEFWAGDHLGRPTCTEMRIEECRNQGNLFAFIDARACIIEFHLLQLSLMYNLGMEFVIFISQDIGVRGLRALPYAAFGCSILVLQTFLRLVVDGIRCCNQYLKLIGGDMGCSTSRSCRLRTLCSLGLRQTLRLPYKGTNSCTVYLYLTKLNEGFGVYVLVVLETDPVITVCSLSF